MQLHCHRNFQKTHYPKISVQSPGSNRAERPAYCDFLNAIVCVSYRQHLFGGVRVWVRKEGATRERTYGIGLGAAKSLTLVPLVLSRVNSSNVTTRNSEPEKCYPTKRTIGSFLSL